MAEQVQLEELRIYSAEVALLDDMPSATELLLQVGWGVAYEARGLALRDSGDGAASIQPWLSSGLDGPVVDVSWDRDHFYMGFHEFGTSVHPQRPAIGPALDRYTHL